MSKHTPGAWVRDAYDIALIRCIRPRGHPEAKHTCGDWETICRFEGDNALNNLERTRAAVHATASIPTEALEAGIVGDLKRALKYILDVTDSDSRGHEYFAAIKQGREVLTKLEGE